MTISISGMIVFGSTNNTSTVDVSSVDPAPSAVTMTSDYWGWDSNGNRAATDMVMAHGHSWNDITDETNPKTTFSMFILLMEIRK